MPTSTLQSGQRSFLGDDAQRHHVASVFFHGLSSILLIALSENIKISPLKLDNGAKVSIQLMAFFAGLWSSILHLFQVFRPKWPSNKDDSQTYFVLPRWVDYLVSATLMVVPILTYAGQRDVTVLILASFAIALAVSPGAGYTEYKTQNGAISSAKKMFFWLFVVYCGAWVFGIAVNPNAKTRVVPLVSLLCFHAACALPLGFELLKGKSLDPLLYNQLNASFSVASKIALHWTTFLCREGQPNYFSLVAACIGIVCGILCFLYSKNGQD